VERDGMPQIMQRDLEYHQM